MEIDLVITPYGRPAAQALQARLAAVKRDDPLRPVTVVVPTNYVGVSARRQLASGVLGPISRVGAGVVGLTLLTVFRLAELLGAPLLAAAGRRPVSTPVLAAAVRRVLREEPGRFRDVAAHPATEEALVTAHRELADLPDDALDALAATGSRAEDVVRLHRGVRDALEDAWYAEADLLTAAVAAVRAGAPALPDLGAIVVHLPQDLRPPAIRLLRTLAEVTPVAVVAGLTGDAEADEGVRRTLEALGAPAPPAAEVRAPAVTADEIVTASDPEDEVREAVRRIVAAARAGTPLERIALLYPLRDPYARLCHEQLAAAGVPANGAAVRSVAERLLGRWLLDLLAVAEGGYRRADVLGLLTAGPVLDLAGRRVPTATWEAVSREAGVVRGLPDWTDRLGHAATTAQAEAAAELEAEDPRKWLVERLRDRADAADELAEFVRRLAGLLESGAAATSWEGLVAWLRGIEQQLLGGPARRASWPEVERRAADRVDAALDRIAALDAVDDEPSPAALARTLQLELADDLGRVGRFGSGVLVGPLSAVLGLDLDLVIVLGCAEGLLPARVREDALLTDAERVQTGGLLRPRADRVAVEHRHLLAALAAAERRVLSAPRGDLRRSLVRPPSRWLLDAATALQPTAQPAQGRTLPAHAPWLRVLPSFSAGIATGYPTTPRQHRLRSLLGGTAASSLADPVLDRGLALLTGRRSDRLTRFDGDCSQVIDLLPPPTRPDVVVAPTRLEAWARCPFHALLEHVLRVAPVEEPEELLAIDPREAGTLVHWALERWLGPLIQQGQPEGEWAEAHVSALIAQAEVACAEAERGGITGHPRLWRRDRMRLLGDLKGFCAKDDARRGDARPVAAELTFGEDDDAVEVVLPDGERVRLRGRIDRVDRDRTGRLLVTDYKTGSSSNMPTLAADPLDGGRRLQLPTYALGARQVLGPPDAEVTAAYWFTSTRGKWRNICVELTDDLVERFAAVLGVIVGGMAAGLFPQRPQEQDTSRIGWVSCTSCDPDGLGSRERRRAWERKRHDPRLAAYAALAEPASAPAPAPDPAQVAP